jgi:transcription elongation factor Elf1
MSSSYIDVKYINLCSSLLERFKQKHTNLWNFRCPICGDSKKSKTKCRGFVYEKRNKYFYKCHNCNYGTSFNRFLEKISPTLHKNYITEQYKEDAWRKKDESKSIPEFNFVPEFNHVLQGMDSISSLTTDHPARNYLKNRLIPERYFRDLYLCKEFKKWTNSIIPNKFSSLEHDAPRLVIPFFDCKHNIIGYQGRSFDPKEQAKYITIKMKGVENLIYGEERINIKKKIYCVEGPLDSLFLPNCLAIAGLNFKGIKLSNVIVLDNERRNVQIVDALKKVITNGYSVCIWPDSVKEKDINEMIIDGRTTDDIVEIIDNNTYSGLQANFQLSQWKRC